GISVRTKHFRRIQHAVDRSWQIIHDSGIKTSRHVVIASAKRETGDLRFFIGRDWRRAQAAHERTSRLRHTKMRFCGDPATDERNARACIDRKYEWPSAIDPTVGEQAAGIVAQANRRDRHRCAESSALTSL